MKSVASSEGRQAESQGRKDMERARVAAASTGGNAGAVPKVAFTMGGKKVDGT